MAIEFDEIVGAARRAVDWGVNLILTPAELDVLLFEVARLRVVEHRLKAMTKDRLSDGAPCVGGGRQN